MRVISGKCEATLKSNLNVMLNEVSMSSTCLFGDIYARLVEHFIIRNVNINDFHQLVFSSSGACFEQLQ